ncbi:MAG: RNA polymerase sigma factor [Roseiflexaceae bacterium]
MMQQRNSTMRPAPRPTGTRPHRSRPAQQPTARDSRPVDSLVPEQLEIDALIRRCFVESEHFYRGQPHDTRFAYELFRRALVERDELAWEHVYSHYSNLVESWVRRSGAFLSSGESSEYFVTLAFTRFWRAITPERFAAFPTLPSLLHYLQLCTGCVVIDSVRAQSWREMLPEESIPLDRSSLTSPDEEAMDRVNRQEFWSYIDSLLNDEAERAVVFDFFVLGMKPGDIYDRRKDLFASVKDVYNVKRNVLGRLSRNSELRRLLAM